MNCRTIKEKEKKDRTKTDERSDDEASKMFNAKYEEIRKSDVCQIERGRCCLASV